MYIGDAKTPLTAVVLIPYWVAEAIKRAGLSMRDCVNYEKIKSCLSTNDMATFMAFQQEFATLIGVRDKNSGLAYTDELTALFQRYSDSWQPDDTPSSLSIPGRNKPSEEFIKVRQLAYDPSYKQDIQARLYGEDNKLDHYDHAYDLVNDIAPHVVGVVVYPGYFSEVTDKALQLQLVEGLLKVFYGNAAAVHDTATTPLFKRHLELLSLVK